MKNTNMIRFTRGAVLAGLVLGSSMAQAWGNRSIALPKVMSNVAAKSFFSNHKLALGLGTAGVALTASAIAFAHYFKQTEEYKNSTGKWDCTKNFGKYVGGKMKEATYATGRGLNAAGRWIVYQLTCHKCCKPVVTSAADSTTATSTATPKPEDKKEDKKS